MTDYISSIDGHMHFGDAGVAQCAVCCLEAERDHWRVLARREAAERDRLLDIATDLWCSLFNTTRETEDVAQLTIEHAAMLPGVLTGYTNAANEERDRLRAVVDAAFPVLRQVTDTLRDSDGGQLDAWKLADVTAQLYRTLAGAVDDRVQLDVSPTMGGDE